MKKVGCITPTCFACVSLSLDFLSDLSLDPFEVTPARIFYSSRSGSSNSLL
jgi:hypothetical protein